MLSHPRKELHKVYVLDKARPSLPRVPTNLLVHPMDSLTDQGVRAQRGEIQSCEGMGTFIAVLLREGHVRLYHAGRKVSQLTVSVCRDLRVFLAAPSGLSTVRRVATGPVRQRLPSRSRRTWFA